MPQPIHTVSIINDTTHDISLLYDTSFSDLISSQFSSPTPSQIANNPFNPPPGPITKSQIENNTFNPPPRPITNIERLLSHAHLNHSFNIVKSSPSFQSSLPLGFPGKPPTITLSSNLPTPDPDQHSHNCIGKQPDTTRTYPTLPLKLDTKFIVPPPALCGDHNNGEQLYNWPKQRISSRIR